MRESHQLRTENETPEEGARESAAPAEEMSRGSHRHVGRTVAGILLSAAALGLALRHADLSRAGAALARADYGLLATAGLVHLLALGMIGVRWRLLFRRPPGLLLLVDALFIAQLANTLLPVRAGLVARTLVVARRTGTSRLAVLSTVVAEKAVDGLFFLLLVAAVLPGLAPQWFSPSSLGMTTALAVVLFPVLVLISVRRQALRILLERAARRWPSRRRWVQRILEGLEGSAGLQAPVRLLAVSGCSVVIAALGVLVNYTVLRALDVDAGVQAALIVLVALQIGARLLPAAPLGGIGIFQYICVEALSLFGVDREIALMYGFLLQAAVVVPSLVLGGVALARAPFSLKKLQESAQDGGPV